MARMVVTPEELYIKHLCAFKGRVHNEDVRWFYTDAKIGNKYTAYPMVHDDSNRALKTRINDFSKAMVEKHGL